MMVWEYFTHFHKSALCYTGVHVYRATSLTIAENFTFLHLNLLFQEVFEISRVIKFEVSVISWVLEAIDNNTIKPHKMDAWLIWTPCYYGQFALYVGLPTLINKFKNICYSWTSIIYLHIMDSYCLLIYVLLIM